MIALTDCKILAPAGLTLDTDMPAFTPLPAGWKIPLGWEYAGEFREPRRGESFCSDHGTVLHLVSQGWGSSRPIIRCKSAKPAIRYFRNGNSVYSYFKWDGNEVRLVFRNGTSASARHTLPECESNAIWWPNLYGEISESEAETLIAPKPELVKTRGEEVAEKVIRFGSGASPSMLSLTGEMVWEFDPRVGEAWLRPLRSWLASLINSERADAEAAGYARGFREGQESFMRRTMEMFVAENLNVQANWVGCLPIETPIAKKENA